MTWPGKVPNTFEELAKIHGLQKARGRKEPLVPIQYPICQYETTVGEMKGVIYLKLEYPNKKSKNLMISDIDNLIDSFLKKYEAQAEGPLTWVDGKLDVSISYSGYKVRTVVKVTDNTVTFDVDLGGIPFLFRGMAKGQFTKTLNEEMGKLNA
jgi:hypothetical protein